MVKLYCKNCKRHVWSRTESDVVDYRCKPCRHSGPRRERRARKK